MAAPVIAVVDARGGGGGQAPAAALAAALTAAGLAQPTGDVAAALSGRDDDDLALDAALAEASDGFGQLDCGRARPWAETAATLVAGRRAAGLDDADRGVRAWTYLLLCADRDGDRPAARHAADRVRALGGSAAVTADVWARYPDIDATIDRDIVVVTVTGPAGAVATLDDRSIGPVPATAFAHAGRHLVAIAAGDVRGATWATVQGKPLTIAVEARAGRPSTLAPLTGAVRQARTAGVDARAAAAIAAAARVELIAAIVDGDRIELWQRQATATVAIATGDVDAVVAAAQAAYAAAHERAPDPDRPLLRDPPKLPNHGKRAELEPTRWWVYAAIGGALVAGAVAIYAADAGDDHQRFELTFP
ncbi:MAG: hypothetical protein IPL61_05900 [Myxococcales bacterium]|nr:hypothetical protein [Myxococcales bacterium]